MRHLKIFRIAFTVAALFGVPGYSEMKQQWIGNPAPSFNLPTSDGKSVSLSQFHGKTVVLHFGAGW